jgi:hypothetical protein
MEKTSLGGVQESKGGNMGFFIVLWVTLCIWNNVADELGKIQDEKKRNYNNHKSKNTYNDSQVFNESEKGDEFLDDEMSDDEGFYDSEEYDGWNS